MPVAKVIEISASSADGFEDAIRTGLSKARATVHGIQGAWINEQTVRVDEGGAISEYRVNMRVTFVLD